MRSVKERIGVEPAPDQPMLVGDEGAYPVPDVDESVADENAHRLAQRRPADLEVVGEGDLAYETSAGL